MTETIPTADANRTTPEAVNLPEATAPAPQRGEGGAGDAANLPPLRLASPDRNQLVPSVGKFDDLVPPEHPVRQLWDFIWKLDLSVLFLRIRSREGSPGAPATNPYLLLALWLQAAADGISSTRELANLCENHAVYRWLCGGVHVAYHTLSDFRTKNETLLDDLLTQSLAVLSLHGLLTINQVAQDGMRTRGAAGTASFRRATTIDEALQQAREQVELLKQADGEDPGAPSRRTQASQSRVLRERCERLEAAQKEMKKLQAHNAEQSPSRRKEEEKIRVSTTDPECHKMKMPDGGFRPAFNIQLATTTAEGVIVGVEVSTSGTDSSSLTPMLEQIEQRCGQRPDEMLVDGGYDSQEAIEEAETREVNPTKVYTPIKNAQKQQKAGKDPYSPQKGEGPGMGKCRTRMGTEEAKEIYKLRASTAELSNAQARNRGLYRVTVRGRLKVRCVALLYALVHNAMRFISLTAKSQAALCA
jgi:transposase